MSEIVKLIITDNCVKNLFILVHLVEKPEGIDFSTPIVYLDPFNIFDISLFISCYILYYIRPTYKVILTLINSKALIENNAC